MADLEIVSGRVERLARERQESRRPNRDQELAELAALEPMLPRSRRASRCTHAQMNDEQLKATRSFRLLTEKPRLVLVNVADDEDDPERLRQRAGRAEPPIKAVPRRLGTGAGADEPRGPRRDFARRWASPATIATTLLRTILDVSGQMLYFTAGEKEVRTWMLRQGGTALEAAANIHTDLARGFIRAEAIHVRRPGPAGKRARDQGPRPRAPGAERLRYPGR